MVGELGNIVSLRLTKPLIVTLTVLAATALAFVVFATLSYHTTRKENLSLKKELDQVRADLVSANKARDTALVRLMNLEQAGEPEKKAEPKPVKKPPRLVSQAAKAPAPVPRPKKAPATKEAQQKEVKQVAQVPSAAPPADPAVGASETAEDEKVAEATETEKAETTETGQLELLPSLSVEKLKLWKEVENAVLKFQFNLKNSNPNGTKIKGYTFVVLKPEQGSPERLRSSPWTPLKEGNPTVYKRGQYFSIARFKFVRGNFPGIERVEAFKTATIYVYSETGGLIVEKVYEVSDILRSQTGQV